MERSSCIDDNFKGTRINSLLEAHNLHCVLKWLVEMADYPAANPQFIVITARSVVLSVRFIV